MDKLNPLKIILSRLHFSKILEIAQQQAPLEACGIIAGIDQTSQEIYQITNALYSPVEFLMNPQEMVKVFWEIDLHFYDVNYQILYELAMSLSLPQRKKKPILKENRLFLVNNNRLFG